MKRSGLFIFGLMTACSLGQHVDKNGQYPSLFPKTPLSESPCLEDQDCVITHLIDGQCCPAPITAASNLYTRDQYNQLIQHQAVVCNDKQDLYTCPAHEPPGHIDSVYQGACVEQRCVKKKVPADAPHVPKPDVPKADQETNSETKPTDKGSTVIETAASPKPD